MENGRQRSLWWIRSTINAQVNIVFFRSISQWIIQTSFIFFLTHSLSFFEMNVSMISGRWSSRRNEIPIHVKDIFILSITRQKETHWRIESIFKFQSNSTRRCFSFHRCISLHIMCSSWELISCRLIHTSCTTRHAWSHLPFSFRAFSLSLSRARSRS